MSLGEGYTVEEQVTGKAEHGGFQFDVFPRRSEPPGHFFHCPQVTGSMVKQGELEHHATPEELGLPVGTHLEMFVPASLRLVWTLGTDQTTGLTGQPPHLRKMAGPYLVTGAE